MKICLVAHFKDNPVKGDIGTKNVASYLSKELSKRHEILQIDVKDFKSWRKIKAFKPQIIHFVLCPSTLGLVIAKAFKIWHTEAKVIMSAPNPSLRFKMFLPLFKPDLILTQSKQSEEIFVKLDFKTEFLPNGVDVEKFVPASQSFKERLRVKYCIDANKFVILHVGPIIERRNIRFLEKLQNEENQVLIIGRIPFEKDLYRSFRDKGCLVWIKRIENIEEIYQMCDCYVFPTPPINTTASIDIPLSVLEAMACNLPVITTRFGALPRIFDDGDGLFFVENEDDVYKIMERIKRGNMEIKTREKVLPYSWNNIVQRLEEIYEKLLISHDLGRELE